MSAEYWPAFHALNLTYQALARDPAPDPLVRRDADGTWFLHNDEWYPVGRLPAKAREAYIRHETEKERRRKYGH